MQNENLQQAASLTTTLPEPVRTMTLVYHLCDWGDNEAANELLAHLLNELLVDQAICNDGNAIAAYMLAEMYDAADELLLDRAGSADTESLAASRTVIIELSAEIAQDLHGFPTDIYVERRAKQFSRRLIELIYT